MPWIAKADRSIAMTRRAQDVPRCDREAGLQALTAVVLSGIEFSPRLVCIDGVRIRLRPPARKLKLALLHAGGRGMDTASRPSKTRVHCPHGC